MNETQKEVLWEKIKSIKVAMMTTVDQGMLRSRPMHLVQDEYSGILYFFVRVDSAKAEEVGQDSAVNLAFSDIENQTYVSMSGLGKISQDREKIAELWNPVVSVWFPDGKDQKEVGLLEVTVDFAEYWDTSKNKMTQLLDMALAKVNNRTPNIGENQKLA